MKNQRLHQINKIFMPVGQLITVLKHCLLTRNDLDAYNIFSDQKQILQKFWVSNNLKIKLDKMQKSESQPCFNQLQDCTDEIRSIGSWSFNQNLLYVIFLQKNKLIMISKKKRRNLRIFDCMAEFISTRNSLQCRSHHQKLLQKFGEVKNIISNFKKYISKEEYRNKFQEIFGKDKVKGQSNTKCSEVKQQALSEEIQDLPMKVQENIPIIVEPKVSPLQLLYNEYLAELNRQMLSYPMLNLFYSSLQNVA